MEVSAQISVYPLRQERLSPAVDAVAETLSAHNLIPRVGDMSTMVTGDSAAVFEALRHAFERAAGLGHVVMHATVSNACPH
jgi:uncharacterized protein YqgV (UPF0045/DUF77 family)